MKLMLTFLKNEIKFLKTNYCKVYRNQITIYSKRNKVIDDRKIFGIFDG